MESYSTDAKVWYAALAKMERESQAKPVWAKVQSGIVELSASECRLRVDGYKLVLRPVRLEPADSPQSEITVFLPAISADSDSIYELRTNEAGIVRLQISVLAPSAVSRFGTQLTVVLTTQAGFLTLTDSEVHVM